AAASAASAVDGQETPPPPRPEVVEIILGSRPLIAGNHVAERFEGGKSIVRDGFSRVFTHDSRLHPTEMGGPLVDLRGQLYGVNIARLSRTSTLALPVDEIKAFLHSWADRTPAPGF